MATTESFSCRVRDSAGLHARPAANLARFSGTLSSDVLVFHREKSANAKSMIAVMAMGVKTGGEVTFEVSGKNAKADCDALRTYCGKGL